MLLFLLQSALRDGRRTGRHGLLLVSFRTNALAIGCPETGGSEDRQYDRHRSNECQAPGAPAQACRGRPLLALASLGFSRPLLLSLAACFGFSFARSGLLGKLFGCCDSLAFAG